MSKSPRLIVSDVHFHSWSAFTDVTPDGMNSRLALTIAAFEECLMELSLKGGHECYVTGYLFHVRGQISPSVLNPVLNFFSRMSAEGFKFHIIPGNHDLESNDSEALSNAAMALNHISGVNVYNGPTIIGGDTVLIPWYHSLKDLRQKIAEKVSHLGASTRKYTLMIHAPLNGVIKGIPDLGLDPAELAAFLFGRVYVGHYHNHKRFDGEVYSVGALTHQTWNDVGTLAGCVIDYGLDKPIQHYETAVAPHFVDLDREIEEGGTGTAEFYARGNYLRMTLPPNLKVAEIKELRQSLMDSGCRGVLFKLPPGVSTILRAPGSAAMTTSAPLQTSVADFIKASTVIAGALQPSVTDASLEILKKIEETSHAS